MKLSRATKIFICTALFFAVSATVLYAEGRTGPYEKQILDNGTTIVTKYMPDSSLVAIQIRVLSGLSNEGKYAGSGISHCLEHLIFAGTDSSTANEITKQIKAMGGIINGATGLDSAEYSITVPKENFDKALNLLSEMVMAPVFSDEEVAKEKDVILKEIKLGKDDPSSRNMELLFGQAYKDSVYRYPVIGYPERFSALTREDIMGYHKAAYSSDRIVVGIAGGVPSDKVLISAERIFSRFKRGTSWWPSGNPEEPAQLEPQSASYPADVSIGYISIGFHTTSLYSPELYSGDVLSLLLGEGNDSRIYKRLVKEKQLLYSVSSINYTPRYPGLFIISGIGDPGKLEDAKKEIFAVIEELRTAKNIDEELAKAKNAVISEYYHAHEKVEDVASSLTTSQLMTGDPAFFEKYVDGVRDIGRDDVQAMIAKYMRPNNSTTAFLLPRGYRAPKEAVPEEEASQDEEKSFTLDNGLRVYIKQRSRLPIVAVAFAVPGGLRSETEANNGISGITSSLLLKGAKKFKENDIVPAIEKMGGTISSFSGFNSMGIAMSLLSKDLSSAMNIFEAVIKDPTFPAEELEKSKSKALASLKEQESDIFESGMNQLRAVIYKDHPYGMNSLGSPESIKAFSRDDIIGFYKERAAPERAVLSIVGDVDIERTAAEITKRFGNWQAETAAIETEAVKPLKSKVVKDIKMRKEQSLVLVGFDGVTISDERKYSLSMISSILSGSDGLLFYSLRQSEGLTYASGALSVPGVDGGYFALYAATTEANVDKVRKTVFDMIGKVAVGDITDEEIISAKSNLISQYETSMETNSSMAMATALDELYGLGFDNYKYIPGKISKVGREEIKNSAKVFLDPNACAVVTIHSQNGKN